MGRIKSSAVREIWRSRLRRFASLNQTVAEFCQWEGVSTAAFYQWKKKLQGSASANQRPLFVPVISAAESLRESAARVVMIFRDGTRVELPASDHPLIAHVVKSLADMQGGER